MLKIIIFVLLICTWCGNLVSGGVVKRGERSTVVSTEYGEISAVRATEDDAINGSYLLHFFALDPNSLFLPVLLHADMVFYVHTGSGKLSWTEEDELKSADLRRGDVYRLREGSVFFIQSNLDTEAERQKLRIHAIFSNSNIGLRYEPVTVPYSSIRDMVLGFDRKVLQAAFMVPEAEIEELLNGEKPAAVVHRVSETKKTALQMEARLVGSLVGRTVYNILESPSNKKKTKKGSTFNLFKEDKDFENCNGWSTAVTRKKLSALKGTDLGVFMVNLTAGSMMGPHWNPMAAEIAVVLQGRGIVRVVCSSGTGSNETSECRDGRYEVEEGDVFVVPRFHAMAQMAFNNQTLVFMGFSTSAKRNHPQFLAGQASVLRTLDKDVVAMSFNVTNTTAERVLASQGDSVILGCVSCAEEEWRVVEEEREKEQEAAREREEEAARRQEEERKRREEEEEAARRRKEEEEEAARKREEEEAARQEEERKRREEEEEAARRKEEEEEAARQEEERKRREEEEAARKREEEEAARQEEERKRREEEEEAERSREKEEEERRRREEEEEAARQEEEEAAAKEEQERRRQEEEEEARRQEEERKRREEQEEEETRRREEEEEARRQGEAAARREEEEEEERRRQEEEAAARRAEEARRTREEEEEREREGREREEEAAMREERERIRREAEEEARRREEEEEEGEETGRRERQEGGSEEERAAEAERRREEEEEEAWRHDQRPERWQEEGEGDQEEQ